MKKSLTWMMLVFCGFSVVAKQSLSEAHVQRIADAIYIVEGGPKAQVPYGILSIKVENERHAREICLNTIRNNHARWLKAGAKGEFLNYLANRYCPPSDSTGNANWKRNMRIILGRTASAASDSKKR